MKRILFLISCLFSLTIFGQISLVGTADYKFTINGYQGEDPKACGNIYGLRELNLYYSDGNIENLWNGRIWNQNFSHEKIYNKNKRITGIQIYSINRWKTFFGTCDGGPTDDKVNLPINGNCVNQFYANPVHVTKNVTIRTFPIYNIAYDSAKQYVLSSDQNLTITLPDNLDGTDYVWRYSIAGGSSQNFPLTYNNKSVLDIPASDFISKNNYGKIISVWVESSCMDQNSKPYSSNIFNFITYQSAPHIQNSTVTQPLCSYSADGKVTLDFDRKLFAGETLQAALIDKATGSGINNYDLTDSLQNSTQYTIKELDAGTYILKIARGTYQGQSTYTDAPSHSIEFTITKPEPVNFKVDSQKNINCFEGTDGSIILSASGGKNKYQYSLDNGVNWTDFNNGSITNINGLLAGTYTILVKDSNGCFAKNSDKSDKTIKVTLTQPSAPIAISNTQIVQPTGYGLSNGFISVKIEGGTPKSDKSYFYEWRKDSPTGAVMPTGQITPDIQNDPFTIKLDRLPAGKYYLTVKDVNYDSATSAQTACGIISQEFIVEEPDPLTVSIQLHKVISCNAANDDFFKSNIEYDKNSNGIFDLFEDGSLTSTTKGGAGGYAYQWQKEVNGAYQDIGGQTNTDLSNLTEGKYKILVTDKNQNKAEAEFSLISPPRLTLSMFGNTVKCNSQNEGEASVTPDGGTGPYTYSWTNGARTPKAIGLSAGVYSVLVSDANKCTIKGTATVQQPELLEISDVNISNPVCFGSANGSIQIKVSGGKLPYSVTWSNGMTGDQISGLKAGSYIVTFTDANGCSISKEYTLTDPEQRLINLGKDITLCAGDSQAYDISINDAGATYQWIDQTGKVISTNPKVSLSIAGKYTATVTDSKGCTASGSVTIKNSSEVLNPQFMIATHAYVEVSVKLVNTSPTKPQSVEWILPNDPSLQIIEKNDDYLEIKFANTGSYQFGLKGKQGECEKTFYKDVIVEQNLSGVELEPARISNIKEFTIVPNPNHGVYKVIVKLYKEADIKIRLMDMVSHEPFAPKTVSKATEFEVPFDYQIPSGNYLIILETQGEALVKKMIVQ